MTSIAKHSSQSTNTRNIHKGIFSCNLWWFVGVCYIAVEAYWLATGRGLVCFSLSSFCLLVSNKFGKKHELFSLLGTGQNLLGAWGRCKRPWIGYFFFLQSPAMGRILFFHYVEAIGKILTEKNAAAAILFNEIADSDWNALAPTEVNWKTSDTARSQYRKPMSRNIFWRQYLWKEYDLPQYKIFCLIVGEKMIECQGARIFFLAVSHGANTFFHRFLPSGVFFFFFFFSYDNLHLHRPLFLIKYCLIP